MCSHRLFLLQAMFQSVFWQCGFCDQLLTPVVSDVHGWKDTSEVDLCCAYMKPLTTFMRINVSSALAACLQQHQFFQSFAAAANDVVGEKVVLGDSSSQPRQHTHLAWHCLLLCTPLNSAGVRPETEPCSGDIALTSACSAGLSCLTRACNVTLSVLPFEFC